MKWVKSLLDINNRVLDVGSGEGLFAKSLGKNYKVTSLDTPFSKIKNNEIVKADFLKWKTSIKFDAISFWESLEHTNNPQEYIHKAYSLLKKGGYIFIEYPRFDSWESKVLGKNWFHLDPPRHLVHLTQAGLRKMLKSSGFRVIRSQNVSAFEYSIWGLTTSILQITGVNPTDFIKIGQKIPFLVIIIPIFVFSTIIELIFTLFNQSPIGLTIGKKK